MMQHIEVLKLMNGLDYSIVAIIVLSMLFSLFRGFIRELLSLITWVLAFFIAGHYYPLLSHYFASMNNDIASNGLAGGIIFLAILIIGTTLSLLTCRLINAVGFSGLDRVLGVCFGLVRGILIITALVYFFDHFTSFSYSDAWQQALLIPQFQHFLDWLLGYLNHQQVNLSVIH